MKWNEMSKVFCSQQMYIKKKAKINDNNAATHYFRLEKYMKNKFCFLEHVFVIFF